MSRPSGLAVIMATSASVADSTALDLTACDREPIHIPGSIQPHGLLLIADIATHKVVAGAGDLEGELTPDWLGRDLADLIGQDVPTPGPRIPAGSGTVVG